MDPEREDYADHDLPPPVRWIQDGVRAFLAAFGIIAAAAVVSILVRAFLIPG
jgi:hypothetical protein